ncbi:MAG: hypothetical protein U0559_15115, partial [Anaerolineae bacterium]
MRSHLILQVVSAVVLAINPLFAVSAQAAALNDGVTRSVTSTADRPTVNSAALDWFSRPAAHPHPVKAAAPADSRAVANVSPLPAWFTAPSAEVTPLNAASEARGGLPNPPLKIDGFDNPSGATHPTTVSALPAWFTAPAASTQPASPRIVQSDKWQIASSASQLQTNNLIAAHQTIYANAVTVSGTSPINNCDVVTYTIIAATDDMTTTGVVITSAMPSGFTPQFQVFDIGTVGPTQTVTATAVFTASCSAVSGQNIMTLTQDTVAPIVKYTDFVVLPGAITVRKEPAVIKAGLDDIVTWTVTVQNTGYGKVSNVNVTDTLGSGLQYVSGLTTTYIAALAVGESITFPISARVIGCANLDNNVVATWGCADGSCLTPQTAKGSVDLQVRVPKLSYALPAFNIPFCSATNVYTIPVTNNGDTSAVSPTLTADFAPFSMTIASAGATYNGSAFLLPTIPAGGTYNLVFTLTHPANVCTMAQNGSFNFGLNYYDRCGNYYFEAGQTASWQLINTPGQIDAAVYLPGEIYRGDNVTSTVYVAQSGLVQNVVVTQQVPSGWNVVNADGGHVFTISNVAFITWTASATNSLTFNPVFGTPTATVTGCQACGLPATTIITATSSDCQSCQRSDVDSDTTYVQCHEPVLTSDKTVSVPASVCANPAYTYTNTYNFTGTFAVTPTWQSMRFTETLSYQTYLSGTASIWMARSGVTTTATFSEATIGGRLILYNISPTVNITVPGATMWISYSTAVGEPNACYASQFYDWSYLNLGVNGNQQCSTNGVLQEGVFVSTEVPSMTLSLSGLPSTVSDCGEYTITLTARRTSTLPAYDAVIDVPTTTYSILNVVGFTGADPVLTTTDASGYHFYYSDTFVSNTQATVQLHVKLRCGSPSVQFNAQLYYDNLCANNDTYRERCGTGGLLSTPATIDPLLILSKYPEVIYAQSDVVTWTLTVVNSGAGPAYDVTLTDTLGSGLRYYASSITSDQGSVVGVIPITSTNLVTWFLPAVKPKEKVTIIYAAEVIGCTNLTNRFDGSAGCLGQSCLAEGPVVSHVELPPTILLNTNQTVTPIDTCFTRTVTVTVRNAGLLSVYTSTVTETLPTGLNYVSGSTEVSTDLISWQAAPDPVINGQNLSWGPTSGAPLDSLLARIRPSQTVYVRFSVRASCPFAGGQLRVQTRYQDICGTPYSTNASYFVMQQREASLSIVKAGVNLSRTSPSGQLVYGEPGEPVLWFITVTNASNAAPAPLSVITDTLPNNVILQDATPGYIGSPLGSIGGTLAWSVAQINPGQTLVFTASTIISNTDSCTIIDTRNRADLSWGCPSDGCRQSKAPVYANLRTRPVESIVLTTEISPTTINQCGGPITITLSNDGPPAYNVTFTDTLPAGFIYSDTVSISTPAADTVDLGQTVVYTWRTLPSGDTVIVIWARNAAPNGTCAAPSGNNTVEVTYDDHLTNCTNTAQYSINDTTAIDVRSPSLVIDKQPATQITTIGQDVTWTLSLTNMGTGTAYNVVITDLVGSSYLMPVASLGSDGAVPTFDGNIITWTLTSLPPDGAWSATVSGVVTNTGDNRNQAIVSSRCDTGCTSSSNTSTAYSTLLDTFSKGPKVQVGTIGSLAVFTFTTLLPDTDAVYSSIDLTDALPAGLGYQSSLLTYFYNNGTGPIEISAPTSAPAIGDSGDIRWALGDLSGAVLINGVITTTIMDQAPLNQNGVSHTNHMTLTYIDLGQAYTFSDTARVDVVEPTLSLSKAVATSTGVTTNLDGNALITYTLRLTNSGTSPAYSIRLTDAIPSGISVTAQYGGDASSGPIIGANDLTWLINSIGTAPDNVIALTYTARLSQALAASNLINVATGTYWSLTETVPQARSYGPLTDSRSLSTADASVYKSSTPTTLRVGDVTTYSLVFTVPAGLLGMGSGNSTLIDTLPTGLQFITDTETLTWSPSEVTVITTSRAINNSGANQLVTWYFDAITSTLDQLTVVTLTLQAQATGQQINTGASVFNPSSAVYTPINNVSLWQRGSFVGSSTAQNRVIQPVLSIAKSVTPAANSYVGSNQSLTYTLAVANSSNGPAYDIVVSDVLPSGVIFDSSLIDNSNFDQQPTLGATGTITWQVTTLDGTDVTASPRFTITVYAHVDPNIAANLTLNNSAFLTYYDSEPGLGVTTALGTIQRTYSDGSSSAAVRTVNGGIAKTVTFSPPPTATLGTLVTYTLSAPQTPLNVTLYNVQITDTINPSMTIVSVDAIGVGSLVTQTSQSITTTFTSVPSYTQAFVTITARIDNALNARSGALISNTAYLTHSTATALTNTQTVTTLVGEPTLTVTKRMVSSAGNVNAVDGL